MKYNFSIGPYSFVNKLGGCEFFVKGKLHMNIKKSRVYFRVFCVMLVWSFFISFSGKANGEDLHPSLSKYKFNITAVFSTSRLVPNQTAAVTAKVTNISDTSFQSAVDILGIIALYDKNNTMLDVNSVSKPIGYQGSENFSLSLKLPADLEGCYVKAFFWDGTDLMNTNMIPLADGITLSYDGTTTNTPKPTNPTAKYQVFILAGQSNMAGDGMNHEITAQYHEVQENVKIYAEGTVSNTVSGVWSSLRPGFGSGSGTFGPELIFGRDMAKNLPENKVLIVKCGWSGTNLSSDWRPPSAGGKEGHLYTHLITTVKKAMAEFGTDDYEIAGMCWMQGESDACSIYPAREYEATLTHFINDVRNELKAPSMRFVIAMIDDSPTWPEHAIVRQAQVDVADKVPYVGVFDTKDLETDGVHYKTKGILEMGALFADVMMEELSN